MAAITHATADVVPPQRHVWGSGNKSVGGSAGQPVLAVSTAKSIVAYAQNGADNTITIATTSDFHPLGQIKASSGACTLSRPPHSCPLNRMCSSLFANAHV